MKLRGRLVPVRDMTASQRDAMFALMDAHYENVHRDHFEADLSEKHWVIQVTEPHTDRLCGFSTQRILDMEIAGQVVKALFSGDTIIAREHWGDNALAQTWGRLALRLMDNAGGTPLYWFLISKGYKTYRFLPLFFHEYYPRPDRATPGWACAVLDAFASSRYPDEYDPTSGLVRATPDKDRLRAGLADVTPERLQDPCVRFFVERNPDHRRGDELCCLAPLTRDNFTRAAYRVIGPEPAVV
jgi:hypothetical protein